MLWSKCSTPNGGSIDTDDLPSVSVEDSNLWHGNINSKQTAWQNRYQANVPDIPQGKLYTLYRGEGSNNPASTAQTSALSMGRGTYYSLDKAYASYYGTVKTEKIRLSTPKIFNNLNQMQQYRSEALKAGYPVMSDYAMRQGYDSFIDKEADTVLVFKKK